MISNTYKRFIYSDYGGDINESGSQFRGDFTKTELFDDIVSKLRLYRTAKRNGIESDIQLAKREGYIEALVDLYCEVTGKDYLTVYLDAIMVIS